MAKAKAKNRYDTAKAYYKAAKGDVVTSQGVQACPVDDRALMDWKKETKGDAVHITGVCRQNADHNIDRYGRGEA